MNSIRAEAQNFFATAETDLDQGIARVQKALETCRNCSELQPIRWDKFWWKQGHRVWRDCCLHVQ